MARKVMDCRDYPDETGCTLTLSGEELTLSGEEDEVVAAAVQHAVAVHGHQDTSEMRSWMRQNLKDEVSA